MLLKIPVWEVLLLPLLQMKQLQPREFKHDPRGHTASQGQSWDRSPHSPAVQRSECRPSLKNNWLWESRLVSFIFFWLTIASKFREKKKKVLCFWLLLQASVMLVRVPDSVLQSCPAILCCFSRLWQCWISGTHPYPLPSKAASSEVASVPCPFPPADPPLLIPMFRDFRIPRLFSAFRAHS